MAVLERNGHEYGPVSIDGNANVQLGDTNIRQLHYIAGIENKTIVKNISNAVITNVYQIAEGVPTDREDALDD